MYDSEQLQGQQKSASVAAVLHFGSNILCRLVPTDYERACLCRLLRRFATLENSGLLFYNGRFNEKHDFMALEIQEGQVVLKYSTGTWRVSLRK